MQRIPRGPCDCNNRLHVESIVHSVIGTRRQRSVLRLSSRLRVGRLEHVYADSVSPVSKLNSLGDPVIIVSGWIRYSTEVRGTLLRDPLTLGLMRLLHGVTPIRRIAGNCVCTTIVSDTAE